jgi:hypothetical protein
MQGVYGLALGSVNRQRAARPADDLRKIRRNLWRGSGWSELSTRLAVPLKLTDRSQGPSTMLDLIPIAIILGMAAYVLLVQAPQQ